MCHNEFTIVIPAHGYCYCFFYCVAGREHGGAAYLGSENTCLGTVRGSLQSL